MPSLDRESLLARCRQDLENRRRGCLAELASLDEAAARETKSSAGDKYETAREMIAQGRNLVGRTLAEVEASLRTLERMEAPPPAPADGTVGFGSLVETSQGWYLVGASLGEVECAGANVRTLTLASPLGQALKGRKPGDTVAWRGTGLAILSVRR